MDGSTEIHLVETKTNFARGGHYHSYDSIHIILSGKMIYKECDPNSDSPEIRKVVESVSLIHTPANRAHMFSALEDSLLAEIFPYPYNASEYTPYRREIILD